MEKPVQVTVVVGRSPDPDDGVGTYGSPDKQPVWWRHVAIPAVDHIFGRGVRRAVEDKPERALVTVGEQQHHAALEVRVANKRGGHQQPSGMIGYAHQQTSDVIAQHFTTTTLGI